MDQPMVGELAAGLDAHHAPAVVKTKAGRRAASRKPILGLVAFALLALGGCKPNATANDTFVGGPFHMVDQSGKPADQSILDGRWSTVFFGYTYCPDVCPATLQILGQAAKKLGVKAGNLQVVFVSVDPDRDKPETMKAYLDAQAIPVRTVGLTGSPTEVATIAKAYHVYYAKAGTGAEYAVDHSAVIYLMDPRGRFVAALAPTMSADQIAREIAKAEA
jgi:protein SCO1/2